MHLIVDSTGLSVHGEGPWSEHKHGSKKRRGWRKLHILIDQNAFIQANIATSEKTTDGSQVSNLIEKLDDDSYRISIAVAGFTEGDLSVEVREKSLIVSDRKVDEDTDKTYLHRGIATRAFERRFHLADHVQVTGAAHADGMLHIDLERQVPEALKPRQIAISSGGPERTAVEHAEA